MCGDVVVGMLVVFREMKLPVVAVMVIDGRIGGCELLLVWILG